jgi:hypothetical protein
MMKNERKSFYNLPGDILSRIYEYDNTFRCVFSTIQSKSDIRHMSHKIKQTSETIKSFIKTDLISFPGSLTSELPVWSYISRNPFFMIHNENNSFGSEFKILIYPKEEKYTRYKILRSEDYETNIDFTHFDGFVCSEQQHSDIINQVSTMYLMTYDNDYDLFMYKYNGIWMKLTHMDIELGLYLHTVDHHLPVELDDVQPNL